MKKKIPTGILDCNGTALYVGDVVDSLYVMVYKDVLGVVKKEKGTHSRVYADTGHASISLYGGDCRKVAKKEEVLLKFKQ